MNANICSTGSNSREAKQNLQALQYRKRNRVRHSV